MEKSFNWDEIKEKLQHAVKLEKNKDALKVKINILESNIEDDKMVGNMLRDEESMKQSIGQFLGSNEPLDCDIDINNDEKCIVMKFKKESDFNKVYNLLNDMFFGDFFKKIIEAMFGAFGAMFKPD